MDSGETTKSRKTNLLPSTENSGIKGEPLSKLESGHISDSLRETLPKLGDSSSKLEKKESDKLISKYLQPGMLIQNRYEIIRPIKSGGMGAVYEVLDKRLNKKWALKEMIESFSDAQEQLEATERFQREATLLASLDHPNLPRVIDYFEDVGKFYLVMDFIVGTDLNELVKLAENHKMSEEQVTRIAIDILSILDYLHNRPSPIIYRDIKPANIMIRKSDNSTILIDFGIARAITGENTAPKTEIGTVGYAPPEQYTGNPLPVSDLYALGATMHELLSGNPPRVPFQFKPLREILPDISENLNAAIKKALELKYQNRWKSAKEMLLALESVSASAVAPSPDIVQHESQGFDDLPGLGSFGLSGMGNSPLFSGPSTPNLASSPFGPASSIASELQKSFEHDSYRLKIKNTNLLDFNNTQTSASANLNPDSVFQDKLESDRLKTPAPFISLPHLTPEEKTIMDNLHLFTYRFKEVTSVIDNAVTFTELCFHPKRELLITADKSGILELKDLTSFNKVWSMNTFFPGISSIDFSKDGKQFAFNSKGSECSVCDTKGHISISKFSDYSGVISRIIFIPELLALIIAYRDGKLIKYNFGFQTTEFLENKEEEITSIAVTTGGEQLLTGYASGKIVLWDLMTRKPIVSANEHTGSINTLQIAPNNKVAASGGADGTIVLWNMKTLAPVKKLTGNTGAIHSIAYTPDKPYLCSSSQDGTIRVWDLPSKHNAVLWDSGGEPFTQLKMASYGETTHFAAVCATQTYIWKHI